MTLNELTIDETVIKKFKMTCAQHFAQGGPPVCHKARMGFFSDLKAEHGMDRIIPHLSELQALLAKWENEARVNGRVAA